VKILDRKISSINFQKLNELAEAENCSVNQLISKLLRNYQKGKI
jgi:predicted DNA-binding ribbon-helix-helix protein